MNAPLLTQPALDRLQLLRDPRAKRQIGQRWQSWHDRNGAYVNPFEPSTPEHVGFEHGWNSARQENS